MTMKSSKTTTKGTTSGRIERKRTTKRIRLIRMLQARSGHDITVLSDKLSWQPHTTRAALSRLRKAGYAIEKTPSGKNGRTRYRISISPAGPAQ